MQGIVTKFIPPTDTNGPRVMAKCDAGKVVSDWPKCDVLVNNHIEAAKALIKKLSWDDPEYGKAVVVGSLPERSSRWAYSFNFQTPETTVLL